MGEAGNLWWGGSQEAGLPMCHIFVEKTVTAVTMSICDLLREKGPTAVKRRFKTQLTAFSLYMLRNIFTSTS